MDRPDVTLTSPHPLNRMTWFKRLTWASLIALPLFIMFLGFVFHQFESNYFPLTLHEGDKSSVVYFFTGEKIEVPVPQKTGYTFIGWYSDLELTQLDEKVMPAHSHEIYARWEINSYTLTFEQASDSPLTIEYGQSIETLPVLSRTGYIFKGWKIDNQTIEEGMVWQYTESKVATPQWEIQKFTLIFEENGGSYVANAIYDFDELIDPVPTPLRQGYTFNGWYLNEDFSTPFAQVRMGLEDIQLYAKWTIQTYSVIYEENGGSIVPDVTLNYGESTDIPETSRLGYTFRGWYSEPSFENLVTNIGFSEENLHLYAKWEINSYWLIFDTNQGSTITNQWIEFGGTINFPEPPTKENFSFAGWYMDENLTITFNLTTMPSGTITLYAKWDSVNP